MPKIGLYSDLHLHLWKSFGRGSKDGLPVRFKEQVDVLDQMKNTFIAEGCKLVIDGGDGFHLDTAIPIECINARSFFSRCLKKAGISEETVEGNHTLSKKENPTWINRSYYSFLEHEEDGNFASKDFSFHGHKIKLLGFSDTTPVEEIKGYDIVVVHKQPDTTNRHGHHYEGVNWKTLAKNNRLVFFGHYHVNEKLSDNCFIMGPPMHLTFGDEGVRGVWIVNTDDWSVKFIKMNYPDFLTVQTSEEVKDDKNYYRVLSATKKIDSDRVITAVIPEVFTERIKSDDFLGILKEWIQINKKDESYLKAIEPILTDKLSAFKRVYKGSIFHVKIKDFFSIGEVSYDVKKGFHIITGKNADFDSNGSGKTSLFEAIYWCFYGKTTKGALRADEFVRDGEKDCEVQVWLADAPTDDRTQDGDGWVIMRSKKEGLKIIPAEHAVQLWHAPITEGKTKPECDKMLVDILGFDEKVYLSSCYFSQENIIMLTGLGDADRTNMITDLLGFETYDNLHKECGDKLKVIAKEADEYTGHINKLESDAHWIQTQIDDIKKRLHEVDSQVLDKLLQINSREKESSDLVNQLSSLAIPAVNLSDVEKRIISAEEGVKNANESVADTRILFVEFEKRRRELQQTETKAYSDYYAETLKKDSLAKSVESIKKTHTHMTGQFCPTCGGMITKENQEAFITDAQNKIAMCDDNILIFQGHHNRVKKQVDDITAQIDDKNTQVRDLQYVIDQKTIELREANSLKSQLLNQQRDYEVKRVSLERQIESLKHVIVQMKSDGDRIKKSKEALTNDLLLKSSTLTEAHNKSSDYKSLLLVCGIKSEIFTFWSEAFLPSGIRSVLLDKFCNDFNLILNQYLSLVSNGSMGIIITPTKKIGGGAERNKIGIIINNDGVERNYLALSGGEKRRVDVSLCMGLNKYVSEKYCIQGGLLGIIVLDELFSFIDRLGEEAIGGLLYEEGQKRAIYVISHTPEIGSYTRNVWTAVKENGVTRLETEKD